jgi:ABC-type taurine transport system substrate-binding protein
MTTEEMRRAIEAGETVSVVFWREQLQSIIQIWKYEGSIILTWEEAPDGAQYDESRYTKDWRRVFSSVEQVFSFLASHSLEVGPFEVA